MDGWLRQETSTTTVSVKIGPFIDDADGKTVRTAETIAQADVRVAKNRGDFGSKSNATTCTHDEIGMYDCPLNETDLGTLGMLEIDVKKTSCLSVRHTYMVVTQEVYAKFCGSGNLTVATTSNVKKNQALAGFTFLMTDSTNHAPITGRTVSLTRSIDGASFAGAANSVTEVANGIYKIDLATTDLNGNSITFRATATGSDDTFFTIITQP
jgi:hypothetical protein